MTFAETHHNIQATLSDDGAIVELVQTGYCGEERLITLAPAQLLTIADNLRKVHPDKRLLTLADKLRDTLTRTNVLATCPVAAIRLEAIVALVDDWTCQGDTDPSPKVF